MALLIHIDNSSQLSLTEPLIYAKESGRYLAPLHQSNGKTQMWSHGEL